MTPNAELNTHTPRLNPFALPPDTDFRFALLILSILAASIYIYSSLYLYVPVNAEVTSAAAQATHIIIAAHPGNISAETEALERFLFPSLHSQGIWVIGCILLELSLAVAIFLTFPTWKLRRSRLKLLNTTEEMQGVVVYLEMLCQEAGLLHPPSFLWEPSNSRIRSLVFGCLGRYYITLSAGLLILFVRDRSAFRKIILHELAHLRNADVNKTYFTIAIYRAFIITAFIPIMLVQLMPLVITYIEFYFAGVQHPHNWGTELLWRLLVSTVLVYLIRNAVLRTREVYADARVATWDGAMGTQTGFFQYLRQNIGRRWLHPFSVHPNPDERQRILTHPSLLFHFGFWETFFTGTVVFIAFSDIADLFSSLFASGSARATQEIGVVGASLLLAPFVTGFLTLKLWRITLAQSVRSVVQSPSSFILGLGLALGLLFGRLLSLEDYLYSQAASVSIQNIAMNFIVDLLWVVALLVNIILFIKWIKVCISTWLGIAVVRPSPTTIYWVGFVIMSLVMAALLSFFYAVRNEILNDTLDIFTVLDDLNPLHLLALMSLWAYPLASWFWYRQRSQQHQSRWPFIEASVQLLFPPLPRFYLKQAVIVGLIGSIGFCVIYLCISIGLKLFIPQGLGTSTELFNFGIIALAGLFQGIVAAVVVHHARILRVPHGLFAAFVAGCTMTVGVTVVNLIVNPKSIVRVLANFNNPFKLVVYEGAILALVIVGSILFLTRVLSYSKNISRQLFAVTATANTERTVSQFTSNNIRRINPWAVPNNKMVFSIALLLLLVVASGMSFSYTLGINQVLLTTIRSAGTGITFNQKNPYPPYRGILKLNDRLNNNMNGYQWTEGDGCSFLEGEYVVNRPLNSTLTCLATNTNFSNLTYEIQMRIVKGDGGGIIFRADHAADYAFVIWKDGVFAWIRYDQNGHAMRNLIHCCSPAVHKGLGQVNLLAVVANKNHFDFYVNHQKIVPTGVDDGIYFTGAIGVAGLGSSEVAFSNAKVWVF